MFFNAAMLKWVIRSLIAASMLLLMALTGRAQTPTQTGPIITGTWELVHISDNLDKSNPRFPKMTLVIEQESDQVKITEKRIKQGKEEVRTFVYHTDGRGDTNISRVEVFRTGSPKLESVTRIDKNRIVTEFTELGLVPGASRTSAPRPPNKPSDTSSQRRDEWSLDGSGKTLTLMTHVRSIQSSNMIGVTLLPSDPLSSLSLPAPRADFGTSKLKFRRI